MPLKDSNDRPVKRTTHRGSAAGTGPRRSRRFSQADRAYDELKRRILDNEMPAGTLALEQEIAVMLDMSRTPVREALIRLAQEGMVEVRPRHGMRVLPVSADDMQEIYEVLVALEAKAAEIVAARGIGEAELAALEGTVADMDAALAADDLNAWSAADERFHMLLVELSGNRRLAAMVATVWDQAHRARMLTLRLRPRPTDSNLDHAAVVEAIRRGDADAARRVHREHRSQAGKMLVELLRHHGLTQL
jgi:DNA-binding GntR family transcriptional regulator